MMSSNLKITLPYAKYHISMSSKLDVTRKSFPNIRSFEAKTSLFSGIMSRFGFGTNLLTESL